MDTQHLDCLLLVRVIQNGKTPTALESHVNIAINTSILVAQIPVWTMASATRHLRICHSTVCVPRHTPDLFASLSIHVQSLRVAVMERHVHLSLGLCCTTVHALQDGKAQIATKRSKSLLVHRILARTQARVSW